MHLRKLRMHPRKLQLHLLRMLRMLLYRLSMQPRCRRRAISVFRFGVNLGVHDTRLLKTLLREGSQPLLDGSISLTQFLDCQSETPQHPRVPLRRTMNARPI